METTTLKLETKICKTCNIEKSIDHYGTDVYKKLNKTYIKNTCKLCYNQKCNEKNKLKYKNNVKFRLQVINYSKTRYLQNINNQIEYSLERNRKERSRLFDNYIKKLISDGNNLKFADIPQELIELKRKQLKLYRHVKNQQNKN